MVSLVGRGEYGKTSKSLKYHRKYYETDCLQNFLLLFMALLTAKLVKNTHI